MPGMTAAGMTASGTVASGTAASRLPVAAGLLLGVLADELFGDPRRGHPVAGFGRGAAALERRLYAEDRIRGAWFAVAAIGPVVAAAAVAERAVRHHRLLRVALIGAATWTVVGGASLRRIGTEMAGLLTGTAADHGTAADGSGDVAAARELLPSLCGRDAAGLDGVELARATVESIAENTSDSAVAPLFWGAVAGLPGLLGYRAINTLDAMVGHRSPRYARFGTVCARADDIANLVPARITAALTLLAAPVVHGSPRQGWATWRADAAAHPSPNAGRCEAAAAGVLGVCLGGRTVYGGRVENRPALGSGRAPTPADIRRAVTLSRAVELAALALCLLMLRASARRRRVIR